MNNGKVRIYELSRELNLDNREILAVCDELKISVKSHSSTITEVEAARIRSAAEKLVSNPISAKPVLPHPPSAVKSVNPQPVKKQQILEIRKNRPLSEPPRRPEAEQAGSSPPSAPVGQPADAPVRLSQPTRSSAVAPASLTSADSRNELGNGAISGLESLHPETAEPVNGRDNGASRPDITPASPQTLLLPAEEAEAGLTPPPARPTAAPAYSYESPPSTVSRPVLKRARDGAAPARESSGEAAPVSRQAPPRRAEPATGEAVALRQKPMIELRHKPVRPAGGTAEAPAMRGTNPTGDCGGWRCRGRG